MNTTESIIKELQAELDRHIADGKHALASECRQQVIGHETLLRLRAEHDANPSDGLASQIRFWLRKVHRDIDPPTPKRKRTAVTAEPAAEPVSDTA